jgi:hypothetical protein
MWLTLFDGRHREKPPSTEGHIAMAFPALFPHGHTDLRDNSRRNTFLKVAGYFEALLRYKNGRFGTHPR